MCIRPEEGFCCIQYQVCNDPGSFSLSGGAQDPADATKQVSIAESSCTLDYISIPGNSDGFRQRILSQYLMSTKVSKVYQQNMRQILE